MSGRKFILKLVLFLSPLLLLVSTYFIFDPFKVLTDYDDFYCNYAVSLNRDHVNTTLFLRNRNNYDSFIFGNSRSLFYHTADWKKYSGAQKPFHFDGSNESLFGIYHKVKMIDKLNIKIKNVLIVCDAGLLKQTTNNLSILYNTDYRSSGESWLSYQPKFFNAYFKDFFLFKFIGYQMFGYQSWMGNVFDLQKWNQTMPANELSLPEKDSLLEVNPHQYYFNEAHWFYNRPLPPTQQANAVLDSVSDSMLSEMQSIFKKNNAQVRVVISPLYDQVKMNDTDVASLKKIFGDDVVFDFSGANEFTNPIWHYYENSHYRPFVATEIMQKIYQNK